MTATPQQTPMTDKFLSEIWREPPDMTNYIPPKMIDHARQLERSASGEKGE